MDMLSNATYIAKNKRVRWVVWSKSEAAVIALD